VSRASSVSRATRSSTSPLWTASAKRPTSRLAGGVGPGRALAGGGRQSIFQSRAGALQGAFDRRLAGFEHVGDLGGVVAEHVAQHERGALAGRQVLEGDDERELDGLPGLVARLGLLGAVGDLLEQHVGVGLNPDRLNPARGLKRLIHGW
jgi:hypothetical protein